MKNSYNNLDINRWQIKRLWQNYKYIIAVVIGGLTISAAIYKSSMVAAALYKKEEVGVREWRNTMLKMQREVAMSDSPIFIHFELLNPNIPYLLIDSRRQIIATNIFSHDDAITPSLDLLNSKISELSLQNEPILFSNIWRSERYILFYGRSEALKQLEMIPYLQIIIAIIYILICLLIIGLSRQSEQNKLWVGLAKETAHQLGTPTSSLMGWLEYLKDAGVGIEALDEMQRDLARLSSVSERFSKIGSETTMQVASIDEVMQEVVRYFQPRIPKGISLYYTSEVSTEMLVEINRTLFEWVFENLLKNSLDATGAKGEIKVALTEHLGKIMIDIKDSGRGVERGTWRKIFEPGFTTKQRGWGLGLSLSRRIIEDYHRGEIAVVESAIGVGTTIRVTIKQAEI